MNIVELTGAKARERVASPRAQAADILRLADFRSERAAPAAWAADIIWCCLYAEKLKTEHEAERAAIKLECRERGIRYWWEGPADIRDRVDANNLTFALYRGVLQHLARMPAQSREQARCKRAAIGKMWLKGGSKFAADLRAGCEADDHFFPKSLKLAKAPAAG